MVNRILGGEHWNGAVVSVFGRPRICGVCMQMFPSYSRVNLRTGGQNKNARVPGAIGESNSNQNRSAKGGGASMG